MKYEAAEVILVGRAQDLILGQKELPIDDNVVDPDETHQARSLAEFDE